MTIPKFVITLDRQIQRNQEFALNNPGLSDLQLLQSYDGQKLDFLDDWARPKVAENLNWPSGAIGCGLAHMKLWEKCIELDTPILILENDAKLVTNFDTHLEEIVSRLPEEWDVIYFGSNWDAFTFIDIFNEEYGTAKVEFNQFLLGVFFESTNFNFSEPTFYKVRVTYGTHCYLISPKGARELASRIPVLEDKLFAVPRTDLAINPNTLDGLMNEHYKDLNCYMTLPQMSFVKNDKSVSTIWVEGPSN
jgi:GR25 family glycosyltransferase involved in LPS biosynthesis